ncbi:MAG TPA: hydrogen peroxide-inducible genes activator, partial [Flavipsychrobacter sp.]|nr:hydrogen peroxide-inducible genes activator [Flavipsychrobacter sp.]
MTITQLEYVVAVATYKSFVAAAEKCFVTQPTLSMQIQKLEEELGVRLFDRNKHPIAITAIGEKVVAQAKEIIAAKNKVTEIIQDEEKTVEGNFRLAVIPTIAPYIVPAMLEDYVTNYPDVQLQIKEMETKAIIEALYNNELDAALVSTPLNESGTKEYPLFYEQFVCYYAKDDKALAKKLITPEDIEIEKIWLLNEGHCMRNQVLDLCSDYVKEMQAGKSYRYESSNVETLRKMVDRNGGMTVL